MINRDSRNESIASPNGFVGVKKQNGKDEFKNIDKSIKKLCIKMTTSKKNS